MQAVQNVSHLLLQVGDLARAEGFYTTTVGMEVREHSHLDDGRPLVVLAGGLGLTVGGPDNRGIQALEHVAFQVDAIPPLIDRLKAVGATIQDGPKVTKYGTSVYFFDPDGNRIECHD